MLTFESLPRQKTNDWRDEFHANGYAVIKGAIPQDRAKAYQQDVFSWLKTFGTELDIENPNTWTKQNLPIQSKINSFPNYAVMHERFFWEARQEPGVLDAFSKLWGTDELLVSFDSLNVTFPNRKDVKPRAAWQHVDQGPFRKGLHCVQGIINLSHAGPEDGGLVVYPESHKLFEQFFETQTDKSTWSEKDLYLFNEAELEWYDIQPHKVCAEPGDLILWDSRLIHYGAEPTEKSDVIRTVLYACYTPASFATKEALVTKAEIFKNWAGTTHWPHSHIVPREKRAFLEDGTPDPRNRDEPLNKPEMTDQLLKLAGVLAY
jgi:ectoine hydroxylase-related dioxygenase (phytanoyl-CoA dioxygenase family)